MDNSDRNDSGVWKKVSALLLPIFIGCVITWVGINDVRIPWFSFGERTATPSSGEPGGTNGEATGPVKTTLLEGGGVDIAWTTVQDPDVYSYDLTVVAVRPIRYEYSVPRYSGDREVFERHYPVEYLNQLLEDGGREERVGRGQVWHVCVQAMKEQPLNTPIDDYIIPGTKACSDDFTLP